MYCPSKPTDVVLCVRLTKILKTQINGRWSMLELLHYKEGELI